MQTYIVLLRGINVGGKNRVPMAELKRLISERGYAAVSTYIASGNVLLRSRKSAHAIERDIEALLTEAFALDVDIVRVLALPLSALQGVVENKPPGFGERPDTYHSDAIFLMGISVDEAMSVFKPREGVDAVWPGEGVIYSQRLSAERTKSTLGKIVGTPPYQRMTIRSWTTTSKLLDLATALDAREASSAS